MSLTWTLIFEKLLPLRMILFAVIDIIGSIPIIIGLRSKIGHIQSEKASLVAALIMIAFLFLGESILSLIGIDINSFAVAGAFIIFFLALEMILGAYRYLRMMSQKVLLLSQLLFLLIAGAGTLTSLLSLYVQNIR